MTAVLTRRALVALLLGPAIAGCEGVVGRSGDSMDARVDRALNGLRPRVEVAGRVPIRWSVAERLAFHRIPGASVAIIADGEIVFAGGFGVKEAGTTDSVTAATLFQAASISKPVTATATMRLVADGRLALDADVNQYLRSWKVPDNRFTAREKVTLRRIASHMAGLTVHGFRGYAEGETVPTVVQVLDGVRPANSAPVRVDTTPGVLARYSGGGTTVQQLVLTDVLGEPFPGLMKRLVLDPAGMTASTYEQPLPASRHDEAARGHRSDGTMIAGRWHTYPEMAAAGLWTTPTDLAKWALAIAAAHSGRDTTLLPRGAAVQMLTEQGGGVGIGPAVSGRGPEFRFGHNGSNEGFRAMLTYLPEAGVGVAIMVNSDRGAELAGELLTAVMAEFAWPGYVPELLPEVPRDSASLAPLTGRYEFQFQGRRSGYVISIADGRLWLKPDDEPVRVELVAADSSGTFHVLPQGWRFVFAGDSARITLNPAVTFTARRP